MENVDLKAEESTMKNLNRLCIIISGLDSGQLKYYTCAHVNPQVSSPFPMRAHTFFEQQQQVPTNTLKSITEVMQTEGECEVKKHNKISVIFCLSFLDWDDGQHK